jgi:hypothetical protein
VTDWYVRINLDNVDFLEPDGQVRIGGRGLLEREIWEKRSDELLRSYGLMKNDNVLQEYHSCMISLCSLFQLLAAVKKEFPVRTKVVFFRAEDINVLEVSKYA